MHQEQTVFQDHEDLKEIQETQETQALMELRGKLAGMEQMACPAAQEQMVPKETLERQVLVSQETWERKEHLVLLETLAYLA